MINLGSFFYFIFINYSEIKYNTSFSYFTSLDNLFLVDYCKFNKSGVSLRYVVFILFKKLKIAQKNQILLVLLIIFYFAFDKNIILGRIINLC